MAASKEVLDEILKHYLGPDGFYVPERITKHLTKPMVEPTMDSVLTEHRGYDNHDQGEKPITNRRKSKNTKELRADSKPLVIEVPRD
jgi:hypothetical protein